MLELGPVVDNPWLQEGVPLSTGLFYRGSQQQAPQIASDPINDSVDTPQQLLPELLAEENVSSQNTIEQMFPGIMKFWEICGT